MSRQQLRLLAVMTAAGLLLSSCGKAGPTLRDKLRAAVSKAQQQPHGYTFTLRTAVHTYTVTGLVEDDARYSASVSIDARPSWEEVASDDTLADRFSDPAVLPSFIRPGGAAAVKASLPDVRSELAAGRWVVDDVGAPDPLSAPATNGASNGHPRLFGQDPALDAVSALEYVRQVLTSQAFRPFNKNDLDYDPATDTFPKPKIGGPIIRYDSIRADLPTAAQIQGFGGRATLPNIENFRRMSVYVDGSGAVVRVLEKVDVASRLDELLSNAGLKLPRGLDRDAAVTAVVDSLNKLRTAQGDDPIDVHELDLTLTDGAGQHVALPTTATKGSLSLLIGRGRVAVADATGA